MMGFFYDILLRKRRIRLYPVLFILMEHQLWLSIQVLSWWLLSCLSTTSWNLLPIYLGVWWHTRHWTLLLTTFSLSSLKCLLCIGSVASETVSINLLFIENWVLPTTAKKKNKQTKQPVYFIIFDYFSTYQNDCKNKNLDFVSLDFVQLVQWFNKLGHIRILNKSFDS